MKGPERPCSIKPQLRSSRNVLQRSVEPATHIGHRQAIDLNSAPYKGERVLAYWLSGVGKPLNGLSFCGIMKFVRGVFFQARNEEVCDYGPQDAHG
jgi:hypothetical protein